MYLVQKGIFSEYTMCLSLLDSKLFIWRDRDAYWYGNLNMVKILVLDLEELWVRISYITVC